MKTAPLSLIKALPHGATSLLVAVSGGADSVALLRSLHHLAGAENLHAVHCNFHLRGSESDRDLKFVEALCHELQVTLTVIHFNVEEYMKEHGVSLEMACRELRYAEFHKLKKELGCSRIVLGHHLDDNIETMLLNLFRGTGLRGLAAMKSDDGTLWRPLLSLSRKDILDYLHALGQPFVIDSSNLESDVRRNFIRNELLPLLATRWPGIHKSLALSQRNFRADLDILDSIEIPDSYLSAETLRQSPSPSFLIRTLLQKSGIAGGSVIVREIERAIRAGSYPRRWSLSGHEIILDRDGLSIADRPEGELTSIPDSHPFTFEQLTPTASLIATLKQHPDNNILYTSLHPSQILFRHPQKGDRISPLGMKGSSLLSDIMKDAGLTIMQRRAIWLAVDPDGHVIWVQGLKRSRRHLLSPSSDKGYRIYIP
ncbi:MAG: tRNA lysidine(34) synthetase TilS [Bacteroidales bacterium]|nr:tRNA lysidine(34) synthetase TilS [Bacteroidales bacterium]MBD5221140.1 tRNA lysidine(34) synthetase TilS [Bacteroidales bacterium]